MKERDLIRETDPTAHTLTKLNKEINKGINDHKCEKWRDTVENFDSKTESSKLFKLIKNLNGGNKANNNQAMKFKGKYISNPKKIADNFNKQYSSVGRHTSTKTNRKVTKTMKKKNLDNANQFSSKQTREAIKKARASKAAGPDNIATLHLKHIGPLGLNFLTDIFNLSTATATIPTIWKTSTIIPLLKPKKPAEESTSYRPVSLLCPAIKILERLILPTLTEHLPIPDHQHGFRKQHSTVTALNDLNQAISSGFNKKKPPDRTILLQIDLSKAFDIVSHEKLLKDLEKTTLPDPLKRWFNCYLQGKQSRVKFRGNCKTGVPQGAVSSPILFYFYMSALPTPHDMPHDKHHE